MPVRQMLTPTLPHTYNAQHCPHKYDRPRQRALHKPMHAKPAPGRVHTYPARKQRAKGEKH